MLLEPIDERQQLQVRRETEDCLQRAGAIFGFSPVPVAVSFDLTGRAAGMYRVRRGACHIRYNPWIFAKYYEDNLAVTIPHEVAHHVTDRLYGLRNIRPHGPEWQAVMRSLGVSPRATAQYDLSGVPVRRQRRFSYRCACATHQLTAARHNKVRRGDVVYRCRSCRSTLVFSG